MSFWKQFPFIRISLAFISGIIAGFATSIHPDQRLLYITYFPVIAFLFFFSGKLKYNFRWIPGLIIFLFIMIFSWTMVSMMYGRAAEYDKNLCDKPLMVIADISEPVAVKRKTVKLIVTLKAIRDGNKWKRSDSKILVLLQKDSGSLELAYGDRLLLNITPSEPDGALNPGSFDAARFYQYKKIFLQTYVNTSHWRKLDYSGGNPVVALALELRNSMLDIFRKNGLSGREFAVAAALLLGYVDEIDQEVMKDYSVTGAMHILSVSGMHVGIIFIFIEKMLSFLNRKRSMMIVKSSLIILFIWFYAMLTGLSPAVLRAAGMLTLVIAGNSGKRNPNIFNILGVSLFFILLWDPGLLFDIGFLLSYLAVGGIAVLYKPIENIFTPRWWILEKIWPLIAVSISAQLATMPLCLYYFHQFPNYFIITNLLIVPLSNIIIYLAIFCLILGKIPLIAGLLTQGLFCLIFVMNSTIHLIGSLPFSVTTGINVGFHEMLLLYFLIFSMILFFGLKKNRWLFIAVSAAVILEVSLLKEKFMISYRRELVIYSAKGPFLMDMISGNRSVMAGNLKLLENDFFMQNVKKYHQLCDAGSKIRILSVPDVRNDRLFHYDNIVKTENILIFEGKKIGIIKKDIPSGFSPHLKTDLVIVSSNPRVSISDILRVFNSRMIIFDGSNRAYQIRKWKKQADSINVKYHDIRQNGAFIMKF